jgi:NFACT protein RNA binding domain
MNEGDSWENIPEDLVIDCAQLTKANSIEGTLQNRNYWHVTLNIFSGNKKDNVTVIYTPWSNLKKDGSMAVGQVGFKDPRKVCENTEHFTAAYLILI